MVRGGDDDGPRASDSGIYRDVKRLKDGLKAEAEQRESDVAEHDEELHDHRARVAALEKTVEDLTGRIEELEQRAKWLSSKIDKRGRPAKT